jgi:hypothetical protein
MQIRLLVVIAVLTTAAFHVVGNSCLTVALPFAEVNFFESRDWYAFTNMGYT